MNRLTLFLESCSNRIVLDYPIHTFSGSRMTVRNASMFWNSVNIMTNVNDTIEHSEKITFGEGYRTFSMIQAVLRKNWNNIFYIVVANSWVTSPKQVEINKSLRFVTIGCNIVNESRNYDTHGRRRNIVCTLPLTSQQRLNGTVTHFGDRQCSVPLYNGVFKELVFDIDINVDHKVGMDVLLEIEITNLNK